MLIELFFKGDRCSRCGQELFGTINLPDGTKVCFNCFELASAKGENVCWNVDRANPEDPGTGKVISHIVQMIKAKK